MFAIVVTLFGGLSMPALAPVPREAPPDPLGRGYMGIYVSNGTLTLSETVPNGPAAKAGMKAGDVIVRVGTLEPSNFDQVIAHVTSFRPGAVVEIEVQRGTERKMFKLKLAARPPDLDTPRDLPVPIIDD